MNYYNEWDKDAAAWLAKLIERGLLPAGDVDTRSISEVTASDLRGYTQCHFFAGIGGWSLALELAGVASDCPVWTGSCPCQPFSAAGSRKGVNDERHLWPEFQRLISQCKPSVVFGEQVASKDGRLWLSAVRADLEALGYAVGAADLCAAGIGAPHIRQRLFWVANNECGTAERYGLALGKASGGSQSAIRPRSQRIWHDTKHGGDVDRLANSDSSGLDQFGTARLHERRSGEGGDESTQGSADGTFGNDAIGRSANGGLVNSEREGLEGFGRGHYAEVGQREGSVRSTAEASKLGGMGNTIGAGATAQLPEPLEREERQPEVNDDRGDRLLSPYARKSDLFSLDYGGRSGPAYGQWGDADWLFCRDGKWRPVEPGTFPLAHGLPARVGRLRGYGNAIVPQIAATFIAAFEDCLHDL